MDYFEDIRRHKREIYFEYVLILTDLQLDKDTKYYVVERKVIIILSVG